MSVRIFAENDNDVVEAQFRYARTGALQSDVEMYFSLAYREIAGDVEAASNASPIVITSTGHGLQTGDLVVIYGTGGNTAARGTWQITVVDANSFSLDESEGNGAWTRGGRWHKAVPGAAAISMPYNEERQEYCGVLSGAIPLDLTPRTYVLVRYAMDEYFTRWFKIDEQVQVLKRT